MADASSPNVLFFDYSCLFSHLAQVWLDGAGVTVDYLPFSLAQAHQPPDAPAVWDAGLDRLDPTVLARTGHEVVRARGRDLDDYRRQMFAFWHEGEHRTIDGLWRLIVAHAGESVAGDDLAAGAEAVAASHRRAAAAGVFGTPTLMFGEQGLFVKLADLPPDRAAAAALWHRVRDLDRAHSELIELRRPEAAG